MLHKPADVPEDGMIYLASPLSDPDPLVRHLRHELTLWATAQLVLAGRVVFSPIVHDAPLAMHYGLPNTYKFWRPIDHVLISHAAALWTLTLDGWEESVGVSDEREYAQRLGKRMRLVIISTVMGGARELLVSDDLGRAP